jgi:hypothetical protein
MHGLKTIQNLNMDQDDLDSLNDQVQRAWAAEARKKARTNCQMFWTVIGVVLVAVAVAIIVI